MENIVEMKKLDFKYGEKQIFDKLTLNIKKGSFTSIIGPNGSGKSTLMKLIVGLLKAEGTIKVDGITMGQDTFKDIRKKIETNIKKVKEKKEINLDF